MWDSNMRAHSPDGENDMRLAETARINRRWTDDAIWMTADWR
jgi:hypothetical protein